MLNEKKHSVKTNLNHFISLLVLFISYCVSAQNDENLIDSLDIKQNFIFSYDDYIAGRVSFVNQANRFRIYSPREFDKIITLSTSQVLRLDLSSSFRFIDITIRFSPNFKSTNYEKSKVKTSFFNLGTRFYLNNWMQNFQFTRTKGFYADFSKIDSNNIENLNFPDLILIKLVGNTSYVLNPNFSFRSIFKQNESQVKSVGSFVFSLSYNYTKLFQNKLENDTTLNATIGTSYFYNWVIARNFLTSFGIRMGIGYHTTCFELVENQQSVKYNGLSLESELNINLGYNSKKIYTGILFNIQSFRNSLNSNFRIDDEHQFLEFYLGYRFKAPKKLIKIADKFEEKLRL